MTNAVFLGSPPPVGFGYSAYAIAGSYATPIVSTFVLLHAEDDSGSSLGQVAVIIGELVGRFMNDWIMNASIRRNKGVFVAESRLWFVLKSKRVPTMSLTQFTGHVTSLCPSMYAALFFSGPHSKNISQLVH